MDAPSPPPPPKKPISLGAFLAQQEATSAAAAAEEASAQATTSPTHRPKSSTPGPQPTSTHPPTTKKRKSPTKTSSSSAATKKRKSPPKPSAAKNKRNKRNKPNPNPNPHPSLGKLEDQKIYIIRAIEGWRSPSEDGEGKLDIPILGVFRSAERALSEAHAWLKGRWPEEYEFVREERVVRYSGEGEGGEEAWELGWEIEMVTGRDDGIVFVSVEGWVVE